MRVSIALAALLLAGAPVAATTLDFNDLTGATRDVGTVYERGDFRISIANDPAFGTSAYLLVWGEGDSANADPGAATLTTGFTGNIVTLTSIAGASFRFDSIDLADVFNGGAGDGSSGDVQFIFTTPGGELVQTVGVLASPGLQRADFGIDGVTSVSWQPLTTRGPWVQFDNIVLNGDVGDVVPEPATWAMLIAGFAAVGGAMRRRRTAELLAA